MSRIFLSRAATALMTTLLWSACLSTPARPNASSPDAGTSADAAVLQIATGEGHTCALLRDHTVWCWGDNEVGQLGDGSSETRSLPAPVPGLTDIDAIAASHENTCALRGTQIYCWGDNSEDQLLDGVNSQARLPAILDVDPVSRLFVGGGFMCGLHSDGTVTCWGDNEDGEMGRNTGTDTAPPGLVPGLKQVVDLGLGTHSVCAVKSDGTVWCWGENPDELLGVEDTSNPVYSPSQVPGIDDAVEVTGGDHFCVRHASGQLSCWGEGAVGQLGDGSTTEKTTPSRVSGTRSFRGMSSADATTCAISDDGLVYCWGKNRQGQAGRSSDLFDISIPTQVEIGDVSEDDPVVQLSVNVEHACALTRSGAMWCWGSDELGQLALSETIVSQTPSRVELGFGVTEVAVGEASACALRLSGEVGCWGSNRFGNLGTGDGSYASIASFTPVAGLPSSTGVAVGSDHACALTTGQEVYCWGDNDKGAVGIDASGSIRNALNVGLSNVAQVDTHTDHTCAVLGDGTVRCWGSNDGRLGNDSDLRSKVPVTVVDGTGTLTNVVEVATASDSSCARKDDGSVWCWGRNYYGQLGTGNTDPTLVAVPSTMTDAAQIVAGGDHICARQATTGDIFCWGKNSDGQLGDGTTTHRATPTNVMSGAQWVDAGPSHTCGLDANQRAHCWGRNEQGALGDGTYQERSVPKQVEGDQPFSRLNLHDQTSCAVNASDEIWCWGSDRYGRLATGRPLYSAPARIQDSSW